MPKRDDEEPPQFDLFGGKEERDEKMAKVATGSPDYISGGMAFIANLPNGTELSGEAIRLKCLASGLKYHHHNAHGTLIRLSVERGLLRPTGRYEHMKVKSSHARKTPIYRIRSVLHLTPTLPLEPLPPTNARLDAYGRIIHDTCAIEGCPEQPSIVVGSDQRKGHLGMWFCFAHRPNPQP